MVQKFLNRIWQNIGGMELGRWSSLGRQACDEGKAYIAMLVARDKH